MAGHVIVMPRSNQARVKELAEEQLADLWLTAQHVARVFEDRFKAAAMTFDGVKAGQNIPCALHSLDSASPARPGTDEGAIQSDEVALAVGDAVFGNMTQTGATSWFIGSTSVLTGQSTTITVDKPRLALQPWAYNTLECYGCVDCTTYPTLPSKFTNLVLQSGGVDVSADWLLNPKPNAHLKCKETIDIISEEEQNITFQ